jgi:hypothetical protein
MAKRRTPKWTIMVYLAGDNNLTSNCISVLQQLEQVKYIGDEVCVLACFDSNTPAPKGSRYLAINCKRKRNTSGIDWEIHNDLIAPAARGAAHKLKPPDFCTLDLDAKDRGDASTRLVVAEGLRRFINWAVEDHLESERYMLILYGHGPVVAGQTFLAKENPPSALRFEDVQSVLSGYFGRNRRRKIDILACQNCVMNGIETAHELKHHANFMIGSQGLVLAHGWPYDRLINAVVEDPDAPTRDIARKLLKVCARNMLDFAVMDRSSEQSICDLNILRNRDNMTAVIRRLGTALRWGLAVDRSGELRYPLICNAIRLARLEAQSYWGETFVDIYDFCERLIKNCRQVDDFKAGLLEQANVSADNGPRNLVRLTRQLSTIISRCIDVQAEVKKMVPETDCFYIGPELQYSHGLSIYFPWSLPGAPYFFKSWGNGQKKYSLKTAFETYCSYDFVRSSQWGHVLKAFFHATLRNMRRAPRDYALQPANSLDLGLVENVHAPAEVVTINLQKSSSDTGKVDYEIWSNVKNYPRRNYLSPADCSRRVNNESRQQAGTKRFTNRNSPPVSYLGWNLPAVVVETITPQGKLPVNGGSQNGVPRQNGRSHQHGHEVIANSKTVRAGSTVQQNTNGVVTRNGGASTTGLKNKRIGMRTR